MAWPHATAPRGGVLSTSPAHHHTADEHLGQNNTSTGWRGVKASSWLQTIELLPPQSYLSPKFKFTAASRPMMIKMTNWPTTMPSCALVRAGLLDNLLGYLLV